MSLHPEVLAACALLAGGWVGAWLARGQRPSAGRAVAFATGLVTFAGALNGPLHDLAEQSRFSAHMIQHLLLTLVSPPALLAGTPAWMLDALLTPPLRRRPLARCLRVLTRPVPALALYTVALVIWHLPGPFGAALASPAWHVAEHGALMVTAGLAWWPVLSSSRRLPSLHYGAQILYLFAFGAPMTVVAAMVTAADHVLYPFYLGPAGLAGIDALADQRLGGVIMWVPAGVVPLVVFTAVFFRWVAAEPDEGELTRSSP